MWLNNSEKLHDRSFTQMFQFICGLCLGKKKKAQQQQQQQKTKKKKRINGCGFIFVQASHHVFFMGYFFVSVFSAVQQAKNKQPRDPGSVTGNGFSNLSGQYRDLLTRGVFRPIQLYFS